MDDKVIAQKLKELYMRNSKHSQYQKLPAKIEQLVPDLRCDGKYERERWSYVCSNIEFEGKRIADIGGNVGFFSCAAVEAGAEKVFYYEGNKDFADFVGLSSMYLGYEKQLIVDNRYFDFKGLDTQYDIILCLNVLHHLGDDFGTSNNESFAKQKIHDCIENMANYSRVLVLQIGYNWMGDKTKPLFNFGTKEEQIEYIEKCCSNLWNIRKIGIASGDNKASIVFQDLNENNKQRNDGLGEFLNRPLFILERK